MADDHLRPPRPLLVLGHQLPFRALDSYTWNDRPTETNVTDYETVLADFTPLVAAHGRGEKVEPVRLDHGQFRRLLGRSSARLFVIGLPSIASSKLGLPLVGCGEDFYIHQEVGHSLKNVLPQFAPYFRRFLPAWSGWVQGPASDVSALEALAREMMGADLPLKALRPRIGFGPLASTAADKAVAFEWHVKMFHVTRGTRQSGSLFWLPAVTDPSDTLDAILWLIQNACGVQLERPAPDWHARFRLPGEIQLLDEIAASQVAAASAQQVLLDGKARLEELLRFKRLLYEQDEPLERVVWATLRDLGATVTEPTVKGRDDGQIVDPYGRRGLLEIKGRGGALKLGDVRELDDWRSAAEEDGSSLKGILIANLARDLPPTERRDFVGANCPDAMRRREISLLLTPHLFQAWIEHRVGRLDLRAFWDAIFNTNGLITGLPEPADEAIREPAGGAASTSPPPASTPAR